MVALIIFTALLLIFAILLINSKSNNGKIQTAKVELAEKLDDYLYRAVLKLQNREIEALLFSKYGLDSNTTVVVERKNRKLFEVKKVIAL